jgi:hypothetical protein
MIRTRSSEDCQIISVNSSSQRDGGRQVTEIPVYRQCPPSHEATGRSDLCFSRSILAINLNGCAIGDQTPNFLNLVVGNGNTALRPIDPPLK